MFDLILMLLGVYAAVKYGGETAGAIAAGAVILVVGWLIISGMRDGTEAEHNFVQYWKKQR